MGSGAEAPARARRARAFAASRALREAIVGGALLVPALACGPAVSLDDPESGSSSTSTGVGPFGEVGAPSDADAASTSPTDGSSPDLGSVKLDVGADTPLPPGACAPDCRVTLTLVWAYDGPAGGATLDPEDQVAVIALPNGGVVVAEERQGALGLARLSRSGQEQWTLPLSLPCDPCRLVELDLHPSGDLLIAGYGVDGTGTPAALAARVELGAPTLVWATSTPLVGGSGIAPRAGSLVVGDGFVLQPVLEGTAVDAAERLELFVYDSTTGTFVGAQPLADGFGTGDAPPPRAAFDALDDLVVTQPWWSLAGTLGGTVRWFTFDGELELESAFVVEPSLRLATASDGRVTTLGQTPGARASLLYLDSGWVRDPEEWGLVHVLPTVTSRVPALAMDEHGHAYALARVAEGRPGHDRSAALEVLRWTESGLLIWKETLPLALDPVDEPIALALTSDGLLVLGGFLAGTRHVELRNPGCDCN